MVDRHVELHQGDPQKSLAALSSAGSARKALARIADGDGDVAASLVHVRAVRQGMNPVATVSLAAPAAPGTPGARFRILRPHARGGLGEVFVARDAELQRDVALKEIQPRHADDPVSRTSFAVEAEITGGLEHPGIVPVYSLGHHPDGRPFYAMRFIKGDSLMTAIEQYHRLRRESARRAALEMDPRFRQLLRRFYDVCNAIEYAHSRGVLHRDLKPGNIMLGKYGETLVVDWGLAKALGKTGDSAAPRTVEDETPLLPASGSGSAETLPGSALGTPAYMSPEQAIGRLDLLGPPSDVYSLGASLYCLLTGRAPFTDKAVADVLAKVGAAISRGRARSFPMCRRRSKRSA
jgi:eukaryotic-like serine/threonine-protein kinase